MNQRRDSYRISFPIESEYALAASDTTDLANAARLLPDLGWQAGMISDISAGGARIHGKLQLPVAASMYLRFQFPSEFLEELATKSDVREIGAFGERIRSIDVKPKAFPSLMIAASVVNVSLNSATRTFIHNLRFSHIRPGDADQIERFINLRQRYELKNRRA